MDKTRGNDHKLHQERFHLDKREKFFIARTNNEKSSLGIW